MFPLTSQIKSQVEGMASSREIKFQVHFKSWFLGPASLFIKKNISSKFTAL